MVTFSNPRKHAEFPNWPLGGAKRGLCVFNVESHPSRGWRFTRQTTGKPKTATYGGRAAIVDGSDGRTYLLQDAGVYGFIQVRASDFMMAGRDVISDSAVSDRHERYTELKALIEEANK